MEIPLEVILHISSFVPSVSTLHKYKHTCKYLYFRITLEPRQNDNHILILLKLYPKSFFHSRIYVHSSITWSIVCKHPEIKWNYRILSDNPNITPDIRSKYPQYPWKPLKAKKVSKKNDIEKKSKQPIFRNMLKQSAGLHEDRFDLSSSLKINWQIVRDNPTIPWDWNKLTINPSISLQDILGNSNYPWNWNELSYHKDLIKENILPGKLWNWPYLSKRFCIPWDQIHDHNQIDYTNNYLLNNLLADGILTPEFIESHPEINWFTNSLVKNESLSIDYLLSIYDKIPNFDLLTIIFRHDFKWNIIFRYQNIDWSVRCCEEFLIDTELNKVKSKKVLRQEANGFYQKTLIY